MLNGSHVKRKRIHTCYTPTSPPTHTHTHTQNPLIQAMIYPAALFTSTPEQLKGLGHIAREHNVPVMSHLAEQVDSMKHTLSMNPGFKNCSSIFEAHGLLTNKVGMTESMGMCVECDYVDHVLTCMGFAGTRYRYYHTMYLILTSPPLKTYMAHCVYLEEEEVQLFKQIGVGVAHCPCSNLW